MLQLDQRRIADRFDDVFVDGHVAVIFASREEIRRDRRARSAKVEGFCSAAKHSVFERNGPGSREENPSKRRL
jgi:hypothetical protein